MARREWFEFINPDTGRREFECPALQGQYILSKQVANVAGITDAETGNSVISTIWAALSADARGHKVLPKGVRRTTDVSAFVHSMADAVAGGYAISFADEHTVLFRAQDVDDVDADVDENPTGTTLGSS